MKLNELARHISMVIKLLKLLITFGKVLDCIGDLLFNKNS
uniref:Uncharacterized protein n=1 Tax=Vibrio genomosp. F6 TaxID=723172 RepID=A0A0H3ZLA9_9VIBR|nr:hypothetical protein [Vibrio genomosp. F6]